MTAKIELPNIDNLVERYISGVSVNQIAKEAGVARATVQRELVEQGVVIRDRSQAEAIKWKAIKETPGGVERQCGRAWKASKARDDALESAFREVVFAFPYASMKSVATRIGCSKSEVSRLARIAGVKFPFGVRHRAEASAGLIGSKVSAYEDTFSIHLGPSFERQFTVDEHNVDFALPSVSLAIELERRGLTESKSMARRRLEKIIGAGWRLLVILDSGRAGINFARAADQAVAFANMIRENPSSPGQYRVVNRHGEIDSRRRSHFDGWTVMPAPDGRFYRPLDSRLWQKTAES